MKTSAIFRRLLKTPVEITVTESRPVDEGKVLAAYLVELGFKPAYITEARINLWMPEATKVIVGADALLGNGSVINKCGTSLLDMSAQYGATLSEWPQKLSNDSLLPQTI